MKLMTDLFSIGHTSICTFHLFSKYVYCLPLDIFVSDNTILTLNSDLQ